MLCGVLLGMAITSSSAQQRPNIVLVMADDVGYGDIGRLGSPIIQTPHLDRLHDESIRLTNYHTGTTCSPTRAGLLTGQHYNKIGVWHTIMGRSLLRPDIMTLPEILVRNGYHTAIFGKWHLGDNRPMRPQDRGFQYTLIHGGGGIGQTPDYWGNTYFDDTYCRNGVAERFIGYCTDIWFDEALQYMENHVKSGGHQPFFCYLPLNAAHKPHRAPSRYIDKYKDQADAVDPIYNAMVDNIDENMGRLMDKLSEWGISDNTILIFTSDNGTSNGGGVRVDRHGFVTHGYNAGMRGVKGQPYEGGHRLPFFIRYPDAVWSTGKNVNQLSSCLDVLPTLLALCGIRDTLKGLDGENLVPYLEGKPADPGKIYIADTQRGRYLQKYKAYCVMKGDWRLVNGELFNLADDPEQRRNVAMRYPDTAVMLKQEYERWWSEVEAENTRYPFVRIPISPVAQTPINCMDLFPDDESYPAWSQELIRREKNSASGVWKLSIPEGGRYKIIVRQFPLEAADNEQPEFDEAGQSFIQLNGSPPVIRSGLRLKTASYEVELTKGDLDFRAGFIDPRGEKVAAQYVYFQKQ
ncbi:Arylsulfatase A [Parapedobacter composti]|uniref:Arylsulfatase A n=1 Tax=Parapedobacter composti TaxID=623281 RepID=A0A1I1K0C7_9SPHI|nr:arylsulfatase [Parapedobacter composti]SFC51443.1 Arylsulfatase A [Parapedobacter composti]